MKGIHRVLQGSSSFTKNSGKLTTGAQNNNNKMFPFHVLTLLLPQDFNCPCAYLFNRKKLIWEQKVSLPEVQLLA